MPTHNEQSAEREKSGWKKQTITGEDGNCHQAVIASLLDIPLEDAWYFKRDAQEEASWVRSLSEWAAKRGLTYLMWRADSGIIPKGFHEIHGDGGRGWGHVVIGENGKPVFDPHPDNTFLKTTEWYGKFIPCGLMLNYAIRAESSDQALRQQASEIRKRIEEGVVEKDAAAVLVSSKNGREEKAYRMGSNDARSKAIDIVKLYE